jgi:hypothetical protein
MGTLENHHTKNDVISIRYEEIRFRPWAPKLRFSTPEHDLVGLCSLDDLR